MLAQAQTYQQRLSVFTAPVLAADDPVYRGVQVPRRFWKIAAWALPSEEGAPPTLAATAYVLDQSELLEPVLRAAQPGPPPLGAYLTYQVPVADVAALTGLDLGPLVAADRLPPAEDDSGAGAAGPGAAAGPAGAAALTPVGCCGGGVSGRRRAGSAAARATS